MKLWQRLGIQGIVIALHWCRWLISWQCIQTVVQHVSCFCSGLTTRRSTYKSTPHHLHPLTGVSWMLLMQADFLRNLQLPRAVCSGQLCRKISTFCDLYQLGVFDVKIWTSFKQQSFAFNRSLLRHIVHNLSLKSFQWLLKIYILTYWLLLNIYTIWHSCDNICGCVDFLPFNFPWWYRFTNLITFC